MTIEICPICYSDNLILLMETAEYQLFRCVQCDLLIKNYFNINKTFVQTLQNNFYTTENLNGRLKNSIFKKMANDRIKYLMKFLSSGKLIEVGPASGEFLMIAKQKGFDIIGVEASPVFANYLNSVGINYFYGRLEDMGKLECSYNVAALFHLLEHIENPHEFIKSIDEKLESAGLIFVVTPNLLSKTNRLFGLSHSEIVELDHLFIYSLKSLTTLFKIHNYSLVATCTNEYPSHIFNILRTFWINKLIRIGNKSIYFNIISKFSQKILWRIFPTNFLGQITLPLNSMYRRKINLSGSGHELWAIFQKSQVTIKD